MTFRSSRRFLPAMIAGVVVIALKVCVSGPLRAQDAKGDAAAFFENRVRPLLVEQCVRCHGPKRAESGLRVDSRASLLQGGDSGPAIVPGQPAKSLLLKAIRHEGDLAMPPKGKLDAVQIVAIERWLREGAPWPDTGLPAGGAKLRGGPVKDHERAFWSFQPVRDPPAPRVDRSWPVHNDVDRFIQARLAKEGLAPRPAADRRTLLRRATFDLTGLPPTPAEIDAFLKDESPDAFAKVVERLLSSKAYGERWGRHWLDVVRYADTAGETADYPAPLAYKYRNWVIEALSADMPYDEFLRRQVAGDILAREMIDRAGAAPSEADLALYRDTMTATGFIAISRRFGYDVENYHHLTIQDTIDTVGQAVLGLSLGCARCHDHKYDPVSMADYYGWYGIFESTRYSFPGSEEKKRPYDLFPTLSPRLAEARRADFAKRLADLEGARKRAEAEAKSSKAPAVEAKLKEFQAQADALSRAGPFAPSELTYGAIEHDKTGDARIQLRGEKTRLGDPAPRRNLEILGGGRLPPGAGSGRKALALWLTGRDNPLTARVMANRIWQHHFGRGLVSTANDFGTRGQPPTHAELLDWLAARFIENGWSIKQMHRLIMASAAYQQSSATDAQALQADPDARWLWRFPRRRLSAEEIRDSMLLVSGDLDATMGAEHPFPAVDSWGFTQHGPFYGVYETRRRSVYLMQQRLKRHPFLGLFDGADPNASTAHRELTTVPTQALYLMNSEFVHERSRSLARRWLSAADPSDDDLNELWLRTLGRPTSEQETREARDFVKEYQAALGKQGPSEAQRREAAWSAYIRSLLTRNEFLFVD